MGFLPKHRSRSSWIAGRLPALACLTSASVTRRMSVAVTAARKAYRHSIAVLGLGLPGPPLFPTKNRPVFSSRSARAVPFVPGAIPSLSAGRVKCTGTIGQRPSSAWPISHLGAPGDHWPGCPFQRRGKGRRMLPTLRAIPRGSVAYALAPVSAALTIATISARTASGRAARRRARSATSGGRSTGAAAGAAGPESAESAPHSAPPVSGWFCKSLAGIVVTFAGSTPLERTNACETPAPRSAFLCIRALNFGRHARAAVARACPERCRAAG